MDTKPIVYSEHIGDVVIDFTAEELAKVRKYQYAVSGVKFYDKDGKLIEDPYNEFPQSYTIDLSRDYHALLYDLSSWYYIEFSEPYRGQDIIELLKQEHETVKYIFDNVPYSSSGVTCPGTFIREENKQKEEADNG